MDKSTGVKRDVVVRLSRETGLDIWMAKETVSEVLNAIMAEIAAHDRLEIRGFGVFTVRFQRPHPLYDPHTGQRVRGGWTPPTYVVKFKPGKVMLALARERLLTPTRRKTSNADHPSS